MVLGVGRRADRELEMVLAVGMGADKALGIVPYVDRAQYTVCRVVTLQFLVQGSLHIHQMVQELSFY